MMSHFQVGGSLTQDAPSYVERETDRELYDALKAGEFCYVLNSRQMGKSSLLVRTKQHLQQEGIRCAAVDMTRIGSEHITVSQWYRGIIAELWRGFELFDQINLMDWLREEEDISMPMRLSQFIEDVLLAKTTGSRLVIFIDEIDSILGLDFSIDDFFALIRFCYNQRTQNPQYKRIAFAIFGVATPSDLIRDRDRTPFNIGRAIHLEGFSQQEAQVLIQGMDIIQGNPHAVLKEILIWTGGQPFLTQKLCHLVVSASQDLMSGPLKIPPGMEPYWVELLVRSQVIQNWESQDEPEHLRTIRDRIQYNKQYTGKILGLYQQILNNSEIKTDDSRIQVELLLSGLVAKKQGVLTVKNQIYKTIFNEEWVAKQLAQLRPYSQALEAWKESGQKDSSRLLRGQALIDAQQWAQDKRLNDVDYQFLAAGQKLDRQEIQLVLEAERASEIKASLVREQQRLTEQKRHIKTQRLLLGSVSLALFIASGLGFLALFQYNKAATSEVRAIATSSTALFLSNQQLESLMEAIRAKRKLQGLWAADQDTKTKVDISLRRAVYGIAEYHRWRAHTAEIYAVAYSPDGQLIASVSEDTKIKLWRTNGTLLETLEGHDDWIYDVAFSHDGQLIASASGDGTVKVWNANGSLLTTLKGHDDWVHGVAFSPKGQLIASASADDTVKLWSLDGKEIKTFQGHSGDVNRVTFSPNGQQLASSSQDKTVKLWNLDGTLLHTFEGHSSWVHGIEFSPDGQKIASASGDKSIRLWSLNGQLLKSFTGHTEAVWEIAFSTDGQRLVSAGGDNSIKLWHSDGRLLKTFQGHQGTVYSVAFSPDNQTIVSSSADRSIRLWKSNNGLLTHLSGHQSEIWGVKFSPNGQVVATSSWDFTTKLWQRNGTLLRTLTGHSNWVNNVAFSPDGQMIATASEDKTVKLWRLDGTLIRTFEQHGDGVYGITFSPNGKIIASSGNENVIQIWQPDGKALTTLDSKTKEIFDVAFSPDGQILATAGQEIIQLWKSDRLGNIDPTPYKIINGHSTEVWKVEFSPDGKMFASASGDNTIKLWSRDGKLLTTLTSHSEEVNGISFSPDGKFFASASDDKTIKLWALDGTLIATLNGHNAPVWGVSFSPDGNLLASTSENKTAILWDVEQVVDIEKVLAHGCNWLQSYLETQVNRQNSNGYKKNEVYRNLCDGFNAPLSIDDNAND